MLFFSSNTGTGYIFSSSSENGHHRSHILPTSNYNSNEIWFKAATIIFPICGGVILFALIALAIRILKNDNFNSSTSKLSKSSTGCCTSSANSRSMHKTPIDYEAYGASSAATIGLTPTLNDTDLSCHSQNIKPLLQKYQNQNEQIHCSKHGTVNSDMKNENFAKKNQIMSLEYSLLPQSCNDPAIKPNNNDTVVNNNLYRNINLSYAPLQSNSKSVGSIGFVDNKIYEKNVINSPSYWVVNTNYNHEPDK